MRMEEAPGRRELAVFAGLLVLMGAVSQSVKAQTQQPMSKDADPSFEVATIKPSLDVDGKIFTVRGRTFLTTHTSLTDLIVFAYDVQPKQIVGGPNWMDRSKYDIAATPDGTGQPSMQQWKVMFQKLLAERFQLTFHKDQKELPVYVLSVAKGGPKNLKKSNGMDGEFKSTMGNIPGGFTMRITSAKMTDFTGFSLQEFVLDRPVLDRTGIKGRYDFTLTWAALGTEFGGTLRSSPATDNPPPGLFTAIQEQLRLRLDAMKASTDVMVVDKAEKPSGIEGDGVEADPGWDLQRQVQGRATARATAGGLRFAQNDGVKREMAKERRRQQL